ncbi:DUF6578 domain-containing protein [Streptomyces erythrochromogenes]|uniref:DUF6578 domain-containing protein n=1 Tax=Streptomyces erythrochromogenes TaxID=285574 RepID=UPI0036B8F4DC
MTLTVWVDDWQMQCCGEDFAPGDVVSWQLLEADPEEYADVVGGDLAAGIDFHEEHHGEGEGAPTALEVLTINEVHCRFEVPAGSAERVQHPVPGSAVLVPVEEADGWAQERPGVRFTGYLVTARRVSEEP